MKLGTKIKTFRENGGLTQIDLANLTGISRSSIQLYEADKVEIPAKNLEKIAQALNLKVDIFFEKNLSISPVNKSVNNLSISRQLVQNNAKISDLSFTDDNAVFITALNSKVGAGESIDVNGVEVCDTDTKMPFSLTLFKTPPRVKNLRCNS